MNVEPIDLDQLLKVVQIAFYVVLATTAVLTYRAAKRGLLNTVHTEYQKHVIDRLKRLSDELASEFDPSSEHYWARETLVEAAVLEINATFEKNKDKILKSGTLRLGIRVGKDEHRLQRFVENVKSDAFIPPKLRDELVDLLSNRVRVLSHAKITVLEEYMADLARGLYNDTLSENRHWLHNKVNKLLYDQGCGISQIDEAVHRIRLTIQKYFQAFDPFR